MNNQLIKQIQIKDYTQQNEIFLSEIFKQLSYTLVSQGFNQKVILQKVIKIKQDQYCIFFIDKFQKDLVIDKQPIRQLVIEEINDKIQPTFTMITKEELLDLIVLHNDIEYIQYLSNVFLFNLRSIYTDTDDFLNDIEQLMSRMISDIPQNQLQQTKQVIETNQKKVLVFLLKLYTIQYSNILSQFTVQKIETQLKQYIVESLNQNYDIFIEDIKQQMKLNQVQVQYPTFYQITNQPMQKRKTFLQLKNQISNVTTDRIKVKQDELERNLTLIIENDQKLFSKIVQNLFQKLFNSLGYFDITQLIICKNTMSVQQSINSHNGLAILIQKIILSNKNDQPKQLRLLQNIISTIYDLLEQRNYEGLFCLYSAITTSSILRCYREEENQLVDLLETQFVYQAIQDTNESQLRKSIVQPQNFNINNLTIAKIVSPQQNYATYRSCIQQAIQLKQQAIPYLGILKRDLALLAESPTFQLNKQYINFNKLENVYTYCIQALELQTLNQQFDDQSDFLCDQIIYYSQNYCKNFDIWEWSEQYKQ